MDKNLEDLKYSDFNKYPHYVFATAFLVDSKLADYKIGNTERYWGDRTYRGNTWESEVFKRLKNNDKGLTCEYNKILVNDDNEHNKAFETLENWLFDNFEIYEKVNLTKWR